jgi:hypothetical protein
VTELIDRLRVSTTSLLGLPPSLGDLDHEEQRMLRVAGLFAIGVFWFAVALVQPLLLLTLPISVGACVWLIRKRRERRDTRGEDPDDWAY